MHLVTSVFFLFTFFSARCGLILQVVEEIMGYYEPYATHYLQSHVLLIGPAYSGAVACGAWISQMTGLSWVDLDNRALHALGRPPGSPTDYPSENNFRRAQDRALESTCAQDLKSLIATDDCATWPNLAAQPTPELYRLRIAPNAAQLFARIEAQPPARDPVPPWQRWPGDTSDDFQRWAISVAQHGPTVHANLPVTDLEPLSMAKQVLAHLIEEGICHAH